MDEGEWGVAVGPGLAQVADEYVRVRYGARPFEATAVGVPGYDAEVPDPSREADERLRSRLAGLARDLAAVDPERLSEADRVSHAMLTRLLRDEQESLRCGLDEVAVTASMMGAFASVVATVPTASVADPPAARAYLARLARLGGYFDQLGRRHLAATADGRYPTARGVRQAIEQVDGYLASPLPRDPLLRPPDRVAPGG